MAQTALRALLIIFLMTCSARADIAGRIRGVVKGQAKELIAQAGAGAVNEISGALAAGFEECGDVEAATAVRDVGEAAGAVVEVAMDATACAGSVSKGAALGSLLGPLGTLGGAFLGGLVNPSCHDAVSGADEAIDETVEAIDSTVSAIDSPEGCIAPEVLPPTDLACEEGAAPQGDAAACIESCEALYPGCFTYYYDHGCCLCKPSCSDGTVASTAVDPTAPASTCAPTVQYETDFWGADIVPVTTKWADTAVEAGSWEDCCQACTLYSFCQAWTFTAGTNCQERFPAARGCCFLKKASGYEARAAPGMVSGTTSSAAAAECTLEFDTDLAGGDILTAEGADTVVATVSDADCCNACALTPGCGAWTMTPPENCYDKVSGPVVGCCFMKYSTGWVRTQDAEGVLTSGVLLTAGGYL